MVTRPTPRTLIAVGVAGGVFAVILVGALVSGGAVGVDQPVLDFFVRHRTHGLTTAAQALTRLGSASIIVGAALLIGALAGWRRHSWRPLAQLGGAYAGAALLNVAVKDLVARPRPPAALAIAHYDSWSFPSGHAAQATAFWGTVALVVSLTTASRIWRVLAWTMAVFVAVLVGATRCYLGAHWASDVAGGWALGAFWLGVVVAATQATIAPSEPGPAPAGPNEVPATGRAAVDAPPSTG
jgi:undecaprenyl-diphosphatase